MNNKEILMRKLANLAVRVGVNIQPKQILAINASVDSAPFVRIIVEEAYLAGAGKVIINWYDDAINKLFYLYADDYFIEEVPQFSIERLKYLVDNNAAVLSVASSNPSAYTGVDSNRITKANRASGPKMAFYRQHMMGSHTQWSIVAYPNNEWAKTVFPDVPVKEAWDKLFNAIMTTSRVTLDNDPVADWKKHVNEMEKHNKILNEYNFKTLNFKNSLGTDLTIDLVEDHIWAGGGEYTTNNTYFVPNIPTEEAFTMPNKYGVNGKVVSTKPLSLNGKIITDFYLVFKDGKVVDYDAAQNKEALTELLQLDEGSSYLGEVALISHDSPISNLNILFNNTLFDENASCHLALGNAYSMNIKGGTTMDEEKLIAKGYNKSITHVDFMFGNEDMEINGTKSDGKVVPIFRKGNFVF